MAAEQRISNPLPACKQASDAPRGGAPAGNTNRTLHGLHGSLLPPGARRIGVRLSQFRRALCEAVEAANGEITLTAAATIDTAAQWQRHLLLAARWLRLEHDHLEPADRLAFSREVARAATERDKALRALRLDEHESDIDAFYRDLRSGALDVTPEPADAADAKSEPLGGTT